MLLLCLKSFCQINPSNSSTGKGLQTDTIVPISIRYIREANAKLIEREYLLEVNKHQDSIINLNKSYIAEQSAIIKDFQGRVVTLNNANANIKESLDRQRSANKLLTGISVGAIVVSIISVLFK